MDNRVQGVCERTFPTEVEDVQEIADGARESSGTICTEESEAEHRNNTTNPRTNGPYKIGAFLL
jgi:hypothetical protein